MCTYSIDGVFLSFWLFDSLLYAMMLNLSVLASSLLI